MLPLVVVSHFAALMLDAAYMVWLLPEVLYSYTHKIDAKSSAGDRNSGAVLLASIALGIFIANWFARHEAAFAIVWQPTFIFSAGILLMVAGVVFRWYSIRMLGKYFTLRLAIQPGQTVVEDGPYRLIRHPSYSGALLTMLGLGLALNNWMSVIVMLIAGFVGYSYRVKVEEDILVTALGEPYSQYIKSTKRFIPYIY